ncbi:MAG: thioredoxin family protein [Gammaproteobacteria bacterium]|nr:thioredoxin family protein [Gammaproteobacteria bacterium]
MKYPKFYPLILPLLLLASLVIQVAQADDVTIHKVTDLESLGAQAADKNLPILIMFSQEECPYCTIMEENYLKPMLRSGEYANKVIIRKVKIDDMDTLTDFNGDRVEADHLTGRYRAWVTPTLIFVSSKGAEVAPKLVGIGTEGFFAGDIDNAINHAISKLRSIALK